MKSNINILTIVLVFLSIFTVSKTVSSQQLNNLSEGSLGSLVYQNNRLIAQKFTTGNMAITNLPVSLTLRFGDAHGTPPNNFTAKIYSESGGLPNNALFTLSGTTNPATAGDYIFTGTISLAANTAYFIVGASHGSSSNLYVQYFTGTGNIITNNGFSAVNKVRLSYNGGSSWIGTSSNVRMYMSLDFGVLPVELTYFKGHSNGTVTDLQWQTASEENNKGFEIERSGDGKNWEIIDFVQGNGTTTEMQNYQFIDNSPFKGINYYRLRQIDFDGQYEYSDIINITIESSGNKTIQFFPNPVTNQLNIQNMEEVVNVAIYNTLGQLVQQQVIQPNSTNLLTIDTQSLPSNSYILQLQKQDGNMESHRFIKN